jgi:aspartokinase-like uncharacterized kinase
MSDADTLGRCLATIEQKYKREVVIVPGGGVFADLVRATQKKWKFNDEAAHQMAILAMKQMALLLKSINPAFTLIEAVTSLKKITSVAIWSPNIQELNGSSIKANWDFTSDSLAAWLAEQLDATELILIKSAKIPVGLNLHMLQKKGLVDDAFYAETHQAPYKVTLINKHQFNEHTV